VTRLCGVVVAGAVVAAGTAVFAPSAAAFYGGYHMDITEKALKDTGTSTARWTVRQFREAAVYQDRYEWHRTESHCDSADHVPPRYNNGETYPKDNAWRVKLFHMCGMYARNNFYEAIIRAWELQQDGKPVKTDMSRDCEFNPEKTESRPKCAVIRDVGRALHTVQDFYAHGNWADFSVPGEPVTRRNPYGLGRGPDDRFTMWEVLLRQYFEPSDVEKWLPEELITGCHPDDYVDGVRQNCKGRVKHDHDLAKDTGGSKRGKVVVDGKSNFHRAYEGAQAETDRQVRDFVQRLIDTYPSEYIPIGIALFQDH